MHMTWQVLKYKCIKFKENIEIWKFYCTFWQSLHIVNKFKYWKFYLLWFQKNNLEFWNHISIPRRAPLHNYIYGTYEPGPTELMPRKARKKVIISKHQKVAEPENITSIEKNEESSEMVMKINKFLNKCFKNNNAQPINFFHFVLNPNNFARTIENIYHVSFLIRDGFAAITISEYFTHLSYWPPVQIVTVVDFTI